MRIGLLGRKIGMTRVYDEKGRATAVTVIEVSGNVALQRKTKDNDGYSALQVGYDTQKPSRVNKANLGHFQKNGSEPKKFVKEFRLEGDIAADAEVVLSVARFEVGQLVDVIGKSKGKGFQGVMKRHGFSGQGASHGAKTHRRNGSIGAGSTPGLVLKNTGMPGHTGDRRTTVQNLKILQVRDADNVLLITGAVPGPNGSYVVVRPAKKAPIPQDVAK